MCNMTTDYRLPTLYLAHSVSYDTSLLDAALHYISWFQEFRWLAGDADPGGCACCYDVARLDGHSKRNDLYDGRHVPDHGAGIVSLLLYPVHECIYLQVVGVVDLVRRHDPRAGRTAAVEAFS